MTPSVPREPWKAGVVIALCALYALYCLLSMPPGPVTAPDSSGYLAASPIHVLGYPAFLKIVGARGAMIVQPLVFATALASLGIETLSLTSSVLLSAAVVAASVLIPELTTYHYSVLTESLFMSGMIAFLASLVGFVREPSYSRLVRSAVIAALTAILRRTGLAFLPVVPIMVLMCWRRWAAPRLAIVPVMALPMLVIIGGERVVAMAVHGDRVTSLMGRHLFAKAALIDAAPVSSQSPDPHRARLDRDLDLTYAPIRELLSSAPASVRAVLLLYYETCLQGPCVSDLGTTSAAFTDKAVNDLLEQAGRARMRRAPLGYAALTATEYRSLWTAFRLRHPGTVPQLNAFIAANRTLPFEVEAFKVGPLDALEFQASNAVRFVQPFVVALGALTGLLALAGLAAAVAWRVSSPALIVACLAALTAHGAALLSVLFAAGIGRFMLSVWPAVTTAALFAAWWLKSLVLDLRQPRSLRHQDLHLEQLDERFGA
jgi:hypothetical protein